jgi:hypothetical protein
VRVRVLRCVRACCVLRAEGRHRADCGGCGEGRGWTPGGRRGNSSGYSGERALQTSCTSDTIIRSTS